MHKGTGLVERCRGVYVKRFKCVGEKVKMRTCGGKGSEVNRCVAEEVQICVGLRFAESMYK